MKTLGLFCMVTTLACLCLAPAAYADGVRTAIEAANAQFSAAVAKGDGAALAALYSTDGQVMPAGSAPIRGTEAIQKFWQGALDSGVAAVGLKTIDVFGRGPTATEVGEYELRVNFRGIWGHVRLRRDRSICGSRGSQCTVSEFRARAARVSHSSPR